MKVFRFDEPPHSQFAAAGELDGYGTGGRKCESCGAQLDNVRRSPLCMYWEPGFDVVGDFSWPLIGRDLVVTEQALATLEPFGGFERAPVELVENPDRGLPKRPPRVRLPYWGPVLYELSITAEVGMIRSKSMARLESRCISCGTERCQWDAWVESFAKSRRSVSTRVSGSSEAARASGSGNARCGPYAPKGSVTPSSRAG
jgi:hypothetical protein